MNCRRPTSKSPQVDNVNVIDRRTTGFLQVYALATYVDVELPWGRPTIIQASGVELSILNLAIAHWHV